jgi:hypothetical protein
MPIAPEEQVRIHLERRGGTATVSARRLFVLWGRGKPDKARRREVAEALDRARIDASPPLDKVGPVDPVELRLRPSRLSGMRLPGVPGNGAEQAAFALGIAGVALGLVRGAVALVAIGAGIGAIALAIRGRRMAVRRRERDGGGIAVAAALAGVAALALGVPAALGGSDDDSESGGAETATPSAFCQSEEGVDLSRLSVNPPTEPKSLATTTNRIFEASERAPRGAYCAVNALDAVAAAWEEQSGSPGFENAENRVEEIRAFQSEMDLTRQRY